MATRRKEVKDSSDSIDKTAEASNGGIHANLPESKWIEIYVNGDEHFAGMKCMINNKYLRNFGAFLTYITQRLQPSFGAVRNVYSPIHGSRITNLDQLQPNHGYVAAGTERFRKVENGYAQIRYKGKKTVRKAASKVKPANRRIRKSSGRLSKSVDVITIHVYRNGDDVTPPAKFVFTKRELLNWEGIMSSIGEKIQLKSGFVKKLYSLDGEIIEGADELSNRRSYVAVGRSEYFKPKNYREIMQKSTVPAQHAVISQKSQTLSAKKSDVQANKMEIKVGSAHARYGTPIKKPKDQYVKMGDFEITGPRGNLKPDITSIEKYMFGPEESIFKAQQQKMFSTVGEVNFDQDHGGLFRASEQYDITNGANEIQETHDTAVELPIDQIEAEEIDDEITPEMERAMQDLDLNSSQIVAYLPSISNKTSVTPTKQLLRTNTGIQPHYQNTFA